MLTDYDYAPVAYLDEEVDVVVYDSQCKLSFLQLTCPACNEKSTLCELYTGIDEFGRPVKLAVELDLEQFNQGYIAPHSDFRRLCSSLDRIANYKKGWSLKKQLELVSDENRFRDFLGYAKKVSN